MKRILLTGSLIMAAATLSFAGNPKSESKSETKSETKSSAGTVYYWFDTNAAGTIVSGPAKSNTASATDPDGCNGSVSYCGLAFVESKTIVDGSGNRVLAPGITAANRDTYSQLD